MYCNYSVSNKANHILNNLTATLLEIIKAQAFTGEIIKAQVYLLHRLNTLKGHIAEMASQHEFAGVPGRQTSSGR